MTRTFFFMLGSVSFGLGIIGIALPLLPTVPFMILAAFCFAKSNTQLENWIVNHAHFGPSVRKWRESRAISRKGKWASTIAFAFSIALGLWMLAWPMSLIPIAVAIVTSTWIWTRPER